MFQYLVYCFIHNGHMDVKYLHTCIWVCLFSTHYNHFVDKYAQNLEQHKMKSIFYLLNILFHALAVLETQIGIVIESIARHYVKQMRLVYLFCIH